MKGCLPSHSPYRTININLLQYRVLNTAIWIGNAIIFYYYIESHNNDSYWGYLPQHSSRGQRGHEACHLLHNSRGFAVVNTFSISHPSLALGQGADKRSFMILRTSLCSPGYKHSNPLEPGGLAKQQMHWVTARSQLAPRPVSSSDIADASEIVKSQSNHYHSFPEYSSSAPQSVTQEAPEPKLASL